MHSKKYYEAHKESAVARSRLYYSTHKDLADFKARKKAYSAKYYMENKERIYRAARDRQIAQKDKIRKVIYEKKSVPCAVCGCRFPAVCMDFDHGKRDKKFTIGHITGYMSIKKLLTEIAKCEVVCANCHRIRSSILGT